MEQNVKIEEATAAMQTVLTRKLSEKRMQHSLNVSKACRSLAEQYHIDPDIAAFTGLVHDICKETPEEEQKKLVEASELDVCEEEWANPKLWHGIAGAELLHYRYYVTDWRVLYAVRYHTVARLDMTSLEKIVYLADMIEEGRTFMDVHLIRATTEKSLDLGMYCALRYSIQHVMEKGGLLPRHTIQAYNQYTAQFQLK